MAKMLYIIREERYIPSDNPLREISKKRIALYVFCQCFAIAVTVGMSQTIAAIGEPCDRTLSPLAEDVLLT